MLSPDPLTSKHRVLPRPIFSLAVSSLLVASISGNSAVLHAMDFNHILARDTSTSGLVLRCAAVLAGIAVIYTLVRAAASPLRSVPGPFASRLNRLWYLQKVWTGELPRLNIELHRKYGPVVRLAPNEFSLDDPAAVKVIYGLGTNFTKGPWYTASGLPFKKNYNMFQMPENDKHIQIRKKLAGL